MNLQFKTKEDFKDFKIEIKKRLEARKTVKVEMPELTQASVMMLIMNKDGEAHVFLTRRTNKVATHKGQVSFPGGKIDEEDKDELAAALRETCEEAGISSGDIEILGQFDDFFSVEGFHVCTFIGSIDYPCEYKINKDEIDDYIEAPLSIFYNKEYDKIEDFHFKGKDIRVYYYSFKDFIIWGLTARILTEFADKILMD